MTSCSSPYHLPSIGNRDFYLHAESRNERFMRVTKSCNERFVYTKKLHDEGYKARKDYFYMHVTKDLCT